MIGKHPYLVYPERGIFVVYKFLNNYDFFGSSRKE